MPIAVILEKKVSDSVWSATGSFSGFDKDKKPISGKAEILLEETAEGLKLRLDSKLRTSMIMNREVTSYANDKPAKIDKIKEGASVRFEQVRFSLRNLKQ